MGRFSAYHTLYQINKTLDIGVQIEKIRHSLIEEYESKIPTVEQVIEWLEEHKAFIQVDSRCNVAWNIYNEYVYTSKFYKTHKEAFLSAIYSALKYLTNNK